MSEFLRPRLIGHRFRDGHIPLEMLGDLSVLRELLIEAAKWRYLETNPHRSRSPRGFVESVSFTLVDVAKASATPVIHAGFQSPTAATEPQLQHMPSMYEHCFVEGRDAIIDAISAAERHKSVTAYLPPNCLGYFAKFGRTLSHDESIEFTSPKRRTPATLTKESLQRLIHSAHFTEVAEDVCLRAFIPEVDQARKSFQFEVLGGGNIQSTIQDEHFEVILEVFTGYRHQRKAMISGIGKYDSQGSLVGMETIEDIAPLDPLDVSSRLFEFQQLADGWLDGEGLAPNAESLEWLSRKFDGSYPDELPLPYLYPTPTGGVQAEWSLNAHEVSLDIDFETKRGKFQILSIDASVEESDTFDLQDANDWVRLTERIRLLSDVSK